MSLDEVLDLSKAYRRVQQDKRDDSWPGIKDIEKLCSSFPWVVETDITAHFEYIDHHRLLHRIQDIFENKVDADALRASKQLLQRLWGRWSRGKKIGIPQVNAASSFFACPHRKV